MSVNIKQFEEDVLAAEQRVQVFKAVLERARRGEPLDADERNFDFVHQGRVTAAGPRCIGRQTEVSENGTRHRQSSPLSSRSRCWTEMPWS